jgi:PQQ-dependent catabolism-associated CXXCW motif protein
MMRRLLLAFAFAAGLAVPAAAQPSPGGNYAAEADDFGVPPLDILHQGAPHAPTPLTVPGAKRVTTAELYGRLAARQPMVLLYVNEGDNPQNAFAPAGSHWLYGAGRGRSFDDQIQQRLVQKVEQLASGNKAATIVTFCFDAHCWLSYNAALRLAKAGFRNVLWYRGGKEAWRAAGLPLVFVNQESW